MVQWVKVTKRINMSSGTLMNFDLGDVGEVFKDIREAVTGESIIDPHQQAELLYKLKVLENQQLEAQTAINAVEAKSTSLFVSGARPFILWVCGVAVAYYFILAPLIMGILNTMEIKFFIPDIDIGVLFNLMLAMLGMSGMRTYEKIRGVNSK